MNKEEAKALFLVAGIEVLRMWELPNQYWPEAYVEERKNSPWWLVKTPKGMIEIGRRKRVISIDWSDTGIPFDNITEDDVTKGGLFVHAWTMVKAAEYLTALNKGLA